MLEGPLLGLLYVLFGCFGLLILTAIATGIYFSFREIVRLINRRRLPTEYSTISQSIV
jgi:hypothetical protein